MIKTIIRLRNDAVLVFDIEGEQIPEYQGQYEEVKERILSDAPSGAEFTHWFGCTAAPETVCLEGW